MDNVVSFRPREYKAKEFESGPFEMAGTLCGCVVLSDGYGWREGETQIRRTWCLTVPELDGLISMLQAARADVVENSRPFTDPRLSG
jgi:hypothetical protein